MSVTLLSPSWYRVAPLTPRLRSHVRIEHHEYRGQDWYVIQDGFTGRHHRFSSEAYQLVGMMDGLRTMDQIWKAACVRLGDHMPTQDETIDLLARLYRADLLQTGVFPDFADLEDRNRMGKRGRFLSRWGSPLALRLPLLDPDRFLERTLPWVRPLLGWPAMLVWLCVVTLGVVLAVLHWDDLTGEFADALLGMENLLLIGLIYPLLKALHEFGHAYMVKKEGGEVHEMGIMFLVFMPVPYVDASSSTVFRSKYQRMLVGGAGILIELFLAAVLLMVWLEVEPGVLHALAYKGMLVAGVSTVLFNGNPLLRFDAYYVLSDFLEIPNLGPRSTAYVAYLCQRWLLGVEQAESPARGDGEAKWLFVYALASMIYRIFISIRIVLFVAGQFFFIGIILAAWSVALMVVMPVWKVGVYLIKDGYMQRKRMRIFLAVVLPCLILGGLFAALPVPLFTVCEGVVWVADESRVHAAAAGFVEEVLVPSGTMVRVGTPLLRSVDPLLDSRVRYIEARLQEYRLRRLSTLNNDRAATVMLDEELRSIESELAHAREQREALVTCSPATGVFVIQDAEDWPGRFVPRGQAVGYILDPQRMLVRVMVTQADVERVRTDTRRVQVRAAEDLAHSVEARIAREVPAASRVLPSMAFSLEGGGLFALDPREQDAPQVLDRLFQFDVVVDRPLPANVEERVFVRFEHNAEPLVRRCYRSVRRLFLSRFAV